MLEGHQSKEEEEKKKGKEDDEGDVVAVIDDGDCKKERKSKKRFRGDQDGDDGENWMPEGERAAKRRKEAAAEAALTNDQRIIRVSSPSSMNLSFIIFESAPLPPLSLAGEPVQTLSQLQFRDEAAPGLRVRRLQAQAEDQGRGQVRRQRRPETLLRGQQATGGATGVRE